MNLEIVAKIAEILSRIAGESRPSERRPTHIFWHP
jgi:hypothetical protein